MSDNDLLPCPFCGTDKVAVCQSERTDPVFWVECIRCNAEAQPSADKAEAIAAWNTRTTPLAEALAVPTEAVLALRRHMISTPYGDQEAVLLSDVLRAIGERDDG